MNTMVVNNMSEKFGSLEAKIFTRRIWLKVSLSLAVQGFDEGVARDPTLFSNRLKCHQGRRLRTYQGMDCILDS
jgi:hypothetical protein